MNKKEFDDLCLNLRRTILKINYRTGSGHITSSFSSVELMAALYFCGFLKYDSENPQDEDRDYFIISKGHAALAVYAVLQKAGFINESDLWSVCAKGSDFGGHPSIKIPGVETTSGSLGHGLSLSAGVGLGLKIKGKDNKVFCLTGDGELQEGSNWEAAMTIANMGLNNVVWLIDNNKIQLAGRTDSIMSLGDLNKKIRSFGFDVIEINGHEYDEIIKALKYKTTKPLAIIANTVKGYGSNVTADKLGWHGKKPTESELVDILNDLGMCKEDL